MGRLSTFTAIWPSHEIVVCGALVGFCVADDQVGDAIRCKQAFSAPSMRRVELGAAGLLGKLNKAHHEPKATLLWCQRCRHTLDGENRAQDPLSPQRQPTAPDPKARVWPQVAYRRRAAVRIYPQGERYLRARRRWTALDGIYAGLSTRATRPAMFGPTPPIAAIRTRHWTERFDAPTEPVFACGAPGAAEQGRRSAGGFGGHGGVRTLPTASEPRARL